MVPDLSRFPGPLDKAQVMLETAAEVEHMLLVQYLYAALTLKSGQLLEALTPAQQRAVRAWRGTLMGIAIEEMGHLMSVQNLRLLTGAHPTFDREEFPPKVPVYPFTLHLEPLSTMSLAKYVLAEAPLSEDDELGRYREIVGQAGPIRHVGIIYGVLAVLFSSPDTLPSPSSPEHWDQFVLGVAEASGAIDHPEHWHLPEGTLVPSSVARQGDPDHFATAQSGFFFDRVQSLADARRLLQRVGEQGEAPVDAPSGSHYRRFRAMFEGADGIVAFPADGSFVPSLDVETDPRLEQLEGPARSMAQEIDDVYAAMLTSLTSYLSPRPTVDRALLAVTAVDQMTDIRRIARNLVTLPQRPGSTRFASPVFSPPTRTGRLSAPSLPGRLYPGPRPVVAPSRRP
jgi:hypothetical protein